MQKKIGHFCLDQLIGKSLFSYLFLSASRVQSPKKVILPFSEEISKIAVLHEPLFISMFYIV
jgi:hypothetical protein